MTTLDTPHAGNLFRDTRIPTQRNLRRTLRLPQLILFSTVQPVMFLTLFNFVFGGSIGQALPPAAGGEYINWLVPGLLIQVAVFGASNTAIGLTNDLEAGVIDRFRSLPMARASVLLGRTIADLARNGFVIALLLTFGALFGFRYQTDVLGLVAAFVVACSFAFAFQWVMAAVGLTVKDAETAQTASFIPLFPLVFASSVFVPTETMPDWLAAFAENQPVTIIVNAMRGLLLGEGALPPGDTVGGTVTAALVWVAGILAVFIPLCIRLYRRAAE